VTTITEPSPTVRCNGSKPSGPLCRQSWAATYGCPVTEADPAGDNEPTAHHSTEYVVVLRAPSSARFLPEEGCEFNIAVPGLDLGRVRVRTFTSWTGGEHPLPRELMIEVRGRAPSLDEAVTKFATVGRPLATMAGFVANVRVGLLEVHLAYDCTPDHGTREFVEVFLPDERGPFAEGRVIRQHLMTPACMALLTIPRDSARIGLALRQYELALREWYLGGEWLALSHLYIAVETLTRAVIHKVTVDRGISEEELAKSLGVITDDPERPRWRQILNEQTREQIIFDGDSDTYKTAKYASDGLEHGFLELGEIAEHAIKSADKTFLHVRRTILELLELPVEIVDELMTIKPKDVQSRRKVARGRLLGASDDPASEGLLYPVLEWHSQIGSVVREGSTFKMSDTDRITVRTRPGVSFQLTRLELRGRLEDGQAPVEVSEQDVRIEPLPGRKSVDLLASVMPLIDAATASVTNVGQTPPRFLAFNLFGQGVAFFQSAQTLINANQPVEALPSLQGLTTIAARFEQLTQPRGPGVGVVLRLALDSMEDDEARAGLLTGAANAGISVPDVLPGPETTTVWKNLASEMEFAGDTSRGSYTTIIGFHLKRADTNDWDFHTKLKPGPFTDLIASASVIAQLRLFQRGAEFFGWTIDTEKVDGLLASAQQVNAVAARGVDDPPSE